MKKIAFYLFALLILVALLAYFWLINSNNYQRESKIEISIDDQFIKIIRDENGIAYVLAESKADVIREQAFVTAQDQ